MQGNFMLCVPVVAQSERGRSRVLWPVTLGPYPMKESLGLEH